MHTSFLVYAPSYADVALVGFHPLFAYFVSFLPLLTPLGYALLMYWSRLDPDTLRLRSQGSPANTRSEAVMQKVKHSSRMVRFWKLVMGNKVHVFIILGFLLSGVLQSDIISVLQINSDLIIKPASGNFWLLPHLGDGLVSNLSVPATSSRLCLRLGEESISPVPRSVPHTIENRHRAHVPGSFGPISLLFCRVPRFHLGQRGSRDLPTSDRPARIQR